MKVHYPRKASWGKNVMCGTGTSDVTTKISKVTCKTCLRLIGKMSEQMIEDAGCDGEYGVSGYYG